MNRHTDKEAEVYSVPTDMHPGCIHRSRLPPGYHIRITTWQSIKSQYPLMFGTRSRDRHPSRTFGTRNAVRTYEIANIQPFHGDYARCIWQFAKVHMHHAQSSHTPHVSHELGE